MEQSLFQTNLILVRSHDALAVVLELDDEGLNVLACSFPFFDAALSIRVEVLLLLIEQRLRLQRCLIVLDKSLLRQQPLLLALLLQKLDQLHLALSLLLSLLCLSQLQLLIAHLPKLRELLLLSHPVNFLLLAPFNLQRPRPLDCLLHFKLAPLLLLIQPVGFVLCLSNLLVQNLLLVVLHGPQLLDLFVDHLLASDELFFLSLFNSVDAKLVPN